LFDVPGHRVGLAWAGVLLVAAWTVLALLRQGDGGDFGFFPNRNHAATLLAMGGLAALGVLVQAIRFRERLLMALAIPPLALSLVTLFAVSESRAGMLLVVVGFFAWVVLAGKRSLRGNAGKAMLLLALGFCGLFLVVESRVKTRIGETFGTPGDGAAAPSAAVLPAEGRLGIFKDTLAMCSAEPWSGVGPGNFEVVFPQYRHFTNAPNETRCLHPESDWLLLLAETGWPATLCLLAGMAAVAGTAMRRATLHRHSRPLKMASIVAGLAVACHGLFDVPGHRVGLAWAGVLLVAMALRPHRPDERHTDPPASVATRRAWRFAGAVVCAAGAVLLQAQWRGRAALPSAQVAALVAEAATLHAADQEAYQAARANDLTYQPPADADPLALALDRVAQAQAINPLNPHLHHVRGTLALYFNDRRDTARQAFARERRLLPRRVSVPMKQARAWIGQDDDEVHMLWREALRRAAANGKLSHDDAFSPVKTYCRLVLEAGKDETLGLLALGLAGSDPALLLEWAKSARPALLNRELPAVITRERSADTRKELLEIWRKRGDRAAVKAFQQSLAQPPTTGNDAHQTNQPDEK
nr:O-antigen ligase family protein [Akkermansiaceae bacterium]